MSLLTISQLSHTYGDEMLLQNVALAIEQNDKIGLVGFNGSGKSTLLKIIAGEIEPFSGKVHFAKDKKISFLKQDIELDKNKSIYETVMESRKDILGMEAALKKAQIAISENQSNENFKRLADLQHKFEEINGYAFEAMVRSVLKHLDFSEDKWQQKLEQFSGGEQTRIQLAKILLQPFDLLLLDEPTNHLDFNMITWLEKYLINLEKPYIVISHNRSFLDITTQKTIEIFHKKLNLYSGNYSFYLTEAEAQKKLQQAQYEKQQKYIEKTEEFIRKNMGSQKTKQAKSRQKQLSKLEKVEKVNNNQHLRIKINTKKRSGNDVLKTRDLKIGYKNIILAEKINLYLGYQEKVAIIGKNGCGKSTFLKIINGELEPISGSVKIGASLKIGYFDQKHIILNEEASVLEIIWNLIPQEPIGQPLSYLARFGFTDHMVDRKISSLSGGERSRLYLAKLIFEKPNFLILDEPTNHLDLATVEALEKALKDYNGTLIFVSHDKYFLKRIASKFWVFENNSIIETEKSLNRIFQDELIQQKSKKKKKKVEKDTDRKKRTNPLVLDKLITQIELLEDDITHLKEDLDKCYERLSDSSIYNNVRELKEINLKIADLKQLIYEKENEKDKKEIEYLELSE